MATRTLLAVIAAFSLIGFSMGQEPTAAPPGTMPATLGPPAAGVAGGAPVAEVQPLLGQQLWLSADYLLAWVYGQSLPALVTTSNPGTARTVAGVVGEPTTRILFSGRVNEEVRSGLRVQGGYWFDAERIWGVEAGFMHLEARNTLFGANDLTDPILARPFINVLNGRRESVLVTFPNESTGFLQVRVGSSSFYEGHLDLVENLASDSWYRFDCLLGYRYYRYDEGIQFRQRVNPLTAEFVPGTEINSYDGFGTRNEFHGVDAGVRGTFIFEDFTLTLLAKVAGGNLHRRVDVQGEKEVKVPGTPVVRRVGGVYALSSNVGRYTSNDWATFPELGMGLSYDLGFGLRVSVGYSALFLNRVARAPDQIDFVLNPNLFPPPVPPPPSEEKTRPIFVLNRSDVWIQAINFGLEYRY